jgi:hypothetical protein
MDLKFRVGSCNVRHCHVTVFHKYKEQYQNIGTLVFSPIDWLLFSAIQQTFANNNPLHYKVTFDDEKYKTFVSSDINKESNHE